MASQRGIVRNHKDLGVFRRSMDLAMEIFEMSKGFPCAKRYSLTDQIRKSSRSVPATISEARRKRRSMAAFVSKLSNSETEACETQVWLDFSRRCGYLDDDDEGPWMMPTIWSWHSLSGCLPNQTGG